MGQRIVIDPVTRIEGHAKITLHLNDAGDVEEARFHVTEFRGFEKFCEGRPFREMPAITARDLRHLPREPHPRLRQGRRRTPRGGDPRDCGPAPPPHEPRADHPVPRSLVLPPQLARTCSSATTPTRRSATSSASPRSIPRWLVAGSACASSASRSSRPWGDSGSIPRGWCRAAWTAPLAEARDRMKAGCRRAWRRSAGPSSGSSGGSSDHREEAQSFGNFPSLFLALVTPEGGLEHYDGKLRIVDAQGHTVADQLDPARYAGLHRRGGGALVLPQVPVLQAPRVPRRDVPRRAARAPQRGEPGAGRPAPTRSWRSSAPSGAAPFSLPSTITTRASSRCSSRWRGPARSSTIRDILDTDVLAHARRNRYEGVGVQRGPAGHALPPLQGDRTEGS